MPRIDNKWLQIVPANTVKGNNQDTSGTPYDIPISELAANVYRVEAGEIEAAVDLNAGDLVNFYELDGSVFIRKADAANGIAAQGFILDGVAAGNTRTVYIVGINDKFTDLIIGYVYYLSDSTPGGITHTPVTASGCLLQKVGVAIGTNKLKMEPEIPITRA